MKHYSRVPSNLYPHAQPNLGPDSKRPGSDTVLGRLRLKTTLQWKEPKPDASESFSGKYISYSMMSAEARAEEQRLQRKGLDVRSVPFEDRFVLTVDQQVAADWVAPTHHRSR